MRMFFDNRSSAAVSANSSNGATKKARHRTITTIKSGRLVTFASGRTAIFKNK